MGVQSYFLCGILILFSFYCVCQKSSLPAQCLSRVSVCQLQIDVLYHTNTHTHTRAQTHTDAHTYSLVGSHDWRQVLLIYVFWGNLFCIYPRSICPTQNPTCQLLMGLPFSHCSILFFFFFFSLCCCCCCTLLVRMPHTMLPHIRDAVGVRVG